MAQKALGSCDLVGTHVVWLAKSLGIMRFGWNSYMVWLKKTRRKKEEENETLRAMFIRDRERNNTYVRKPFRIILWFFSSVCHFGIYSDIRISEGCFGVLEICVTSDFRRGLFRSFGDMCHFGFSERVVSEFWRYVSLRNFGYSYFRGLFRSFGDMCHFGISDIRISEGCFGVLKIKLNPFLTVRKAHTFPEHRAA